MILTKYSMRRAILRHVVIELLPSNLKGDLLYNEEVHKVQINDWVKAKDPFKFRPGFFSKLQHEVKGKLDYGGYVQFSWRCSETGLTFLVKVTIVGSVHSDPEWTRA